jgi:hypothetical protein
MSWHQLLTSKIVGTAENRQVLFAPWNALAAGDAGVDRAPDSGL